MKLAITIHAITAGKGVKIPPKTAHEFADADFTDLEKIGAIREATDAERQIFESQKKPTKAKPAKPAKAKPAATATPAEEKPVEPKADADPDVKPNDDDILNG